MLAPSPAAATRPPCRIRRASWRDVKPVATLCADAFADVPGAIPGQALQLDGLAGFVEGRYIAAMAREVTKAFSLALAKKEEAAAEAHRANRSRRRPPAGSAAAASQLRLRQFTCLVAEGAPGEGLAGCVFLSKRAVGALLPPPFPSSRPYELVVSNLSVARDQRRRGVATALLDAAARLAARWGTDAALSLEVEAANAGARRLYERAGYAEVGEDPWWVPLLTASTKKVQLRRPVAPLLRGGCAEAAAPHG